MSPAPANLMPPMHRFVSMSRPHPYPVARPSANRMHSVHYPVSPMSEHLTHKMSLAPPDPMHPMHLST